MSNGDGVFQEIIQLCGMGDLEYVKNRIFGLSFQSGGFKDIIFPSDPDHPSVLCQVSKMSSGLRLAGPISDLGTP